MIAEWWKSLGCYPPEYNRAVHGPYYPWRYYGKKDTPFGEVKLNELPAWIKRRDKSPRSAFNLIGRGYNGWLYKFVYPKKAGVAWLFQWSVMLSTWSYLIVWSSLRSHKRAKFHW